MRIGMLAEDTNYRFWFTEYASYMQIIPDYTKVSSQCFYLKTLLRITYSLVTNTLCWTNKDC